MSLYVVTRKSDGAEVYRYNNDAPVEWAGLEFATHDHTPQASEPSATALDVKTWRIYVGPFFDRFGAYKIPILASPDLVVQAIVKDCSVRKFIALVERRADLLVAIGILQAKGFPINTAAVLDIQPQGEDIYHGE